MKKPLGQKHLIYCCHCNAAQLVRIGYVPYGLRKKTKR
jgi:hypothetical protein